MKILILTAGDWTTDKHKIAYKPLIPLSQRPNRDNWPLTTLYRTDTSHTCSASSKTLKFYRRLQSDLYFRFYGSFPVLFIFEYISLHDWPIKVWDSSNWSLWPNKSFEFYKLGVGIIWGYLRSFWVKIQSFSNLDKLYIKVNLFVPWFA